MGKNYSKLTLDGIVEIAGRLSNDFIKYSGNTKYQVPNKLIYKIDDAKEDPSIERSARIAALKAVGNDGPLVKLAFTRDGKVIGRNQKQAFDTRRINQEVTRNPRTNLQYWNRSQQFIDDEAHDKLNTFAKLVDPLNDIKKQYGTEPEYFESYARVLDDLIKRVCQLNSNEVEVFKPQIAYLEQLLFARYRLSLGDIKNMSREALRARIMQKDEHLLKRGRYQNITTQESFESKGSTVKDGNKGPLTQESIVNAIFGNNDFRRDGEKKVQRTITITICDEVQD